MKQIKNNTITAYSFSIFDKYPKILNIVSTRIGGLSKGKYSSLNISLNIADESKVVLHNRKLISEFIGVDHSLLTCGQQTHNDQVVVVTEENIGMGSRSFQDAFPDTDALVTKVTGVPLMIQVADCAPVSFYDPVNHVIGVAHAGRIGVEKEIVIKTLETMHDAYGTCADNVIVGIGPCIYPCCYPVDLSNSIFNQLINCGVEADNIEVSNICTSCNNDIFFSYRADDRKTGRFANIIMLQK